MDWYREAGRQRSRVLYAFRGPTGARVGRDALDPETARSIAAQHLHVRFDWAAIAAERQIVESAPELRRRRPREVESEIAEDPPEAQPEAQNAAPQAEARPADPGPDPGPDAPPPRVMFPSTIEGGTPEEQVAFLVRWYPVIRERVLLRASDLDRQQALMALADRLNTESWTDADAVAAGLPGAAEALQRLSLVFARRRRTRRRSSAGSGPSAGEPPSPA